MSKNKRFKSEALQYAYEQIVGDDPKREADIEQEIVNVEAAQLIHDMRIRAGLSQRELARKVGTSASAINRLESADYDGHTLAMVRRIATAMNRRLELRAVPVRSRKPKRRAA